MAQKIKVEFPAELSLLLKMDKTELSREIQKLTLLKLYELGKISSGKAADLLNISRLEFLDILGQYKISTMSIYDEEELLEDTRNA